MGDAMSQPAWIYECDGERSDAFDDRSEAIKAAAAEFQLTISEVAALSSDGLLPIGLRSTLKVANKNDHPYDF